jgi:hypothetical protein
VSATGLYVLANDTVRHQLAALLNSLAANVAAPPPVCVIPYDDRLQAVRQEIAGRAGVTLWDDAATLAAWDGFAARAWRAHPRALRLWRPRGEPGGLHRFGSHRRLAVFDGPFERFLYLDADVLVLGSPEALLAALDRHPFVVHDDQFRAPRHVFDLASPRLPVLFPPPALDGIFCAGIFAARRGLFDAAAREGLLEALAAGEADVLYPWAPDQSLLNYMVLRRGVPVHNLYRAAGAAAVATCATVPGLEERAGRLYDRGRPLPFLHYIGIHPPAFNAVCAGRDVRFPYRELFLHYRYLSDPAARPGLRGRPRAYNAPPALWRRLAWRARRLLRARA